MMHCRMCLKLTDENHPFLLKKDRVFICEECWSKLRLLYENDKENKDEVENKDNVQHMR